MYKDEDLLSSQNSSNAIVSRSQFKPILFSSEMVKAIMEGRKTQTMRILKLHKAIVNPEFGYTCFTPDRSISVRGLHGGIYGESFIKCPYGKKEDILWVRETFGLSGNRIFYRADNDNFENSGLQGLYDFKWKPSIFMSKDDCRIFLKITNIRVERLQEISEVSSIAEGIEILRPFPLVHRYRNYLFDDDYVDTAIESYASLWERINGINSWLENPFVWVITFERTERPKGFC